MTNIHATANFLNYLNQHSLKDAKLVESNYNYVNTWSFMQCCAVLIVGYFQVYIMKRLFATPNVTPSGKPRAWIFVVFVVIILFVWIFVKKTKKNLVEMCWRTSNVYSIQYKTVYYIIVFWQNQYGKLENWKKKQNVVKEKPLKIIFVFNLVLDWQR